MATQFAFELVSPERLLVSKPVAMVTIPGGEGVYGVLPDHAPMITTLQAGVLDIYADDASTITERIFVTEGFVEVLQSRCTVLAEEATPVSELELEPLREELKSAQKSLAEAKIEKDQLAFQAIIRLLEAKIVAATPVY